jgi:hypothetical protein
MRAPTAGFGASVFDGNSVQRTGFGLSFDLSSNEIYAVDANGTSTGIGVFPSKFAGYFANDVNGITRQFGGLSLDGMTNIWDEQYPNGVTRVSAAQVAPDFVNPANRRGNAFVLWDQNIIKFYIRMLYFSSQTARKQIIFVDVIEKKKRALEPADLKTALKT